MTAGGEKLSGRVLNGTFVVDEPIGEGGMGVVYAAHNAKLESIRYAVKVLRPDGGAIGDLEAQRFKREAQVLAALEHPSIVRPIHADVTPEGEPYLVMEFVRGTSLREKITLARRTDIPLPASYVVAVLGGVAEGLDHAHGRGVVHRDLKPENVLVIEGGRNVMVKVLDFGIAKILREGSKPAENLTQTAEIAGTVGYMSPEQCRDIRTAGSPSDVFSLGILAYELLAGERPFDGPNAAGTICNILLNPLPPIGRARSELGPGVDAVLARACAKDPDQRFASAMAFVDALAAALGVADSASRARLSNTTGPHDATLDEGTAATLLPNPQSSRELSRAVAEVSSRRVTSAFADGDTVHAPARRDGPAPPTILRDARASDRRSRWPAALAVLGGILGGLIVVKYFRPPTAPPPIVPPVAPAPAAEATCPGSAHAATPGLFDDEACITAGEFSMGSPRGVGDSDEFPPHTVRLRAFYVDRYEITVARFRRCVTAGACDPGGLDTVGPLDAHGHVDPRGTVFRPDEHCTYRDHPTPNDTKPANCLSYAQAVQLCRFEGRRLPTEAEWERAARGSGETRRTYPWGEQPPDCTRASFGYGAGCGLAEPPPVGTATEGATPEGVYDLAGSVTEWTADWYSDAYYTHSVTENPGGATLDEARVHTGGADYCRDGCRVTRGGAWNTLLSLTGWLRSAHRTVDPYNRRGPQLGARCARTP